MNRADRRGNSGANGTRAEARVGTASRRTVMNDPGKASRQNRRTPGLRIPLLLGWAPPEEARGSGRYATFPPQAVQARASARVEDRFAANGRDDPGRSIAANRRIPGLGSRCYSAGHANETRRFRGIHCPFSAAGGPGPVLQHGSRTASRRTVVNDPGKAQRKNSRIPTLRSPNCPLITGNEPRIPGAFMPLLRRRRSRPVLQHGSKRTASRRTVVNDPGKASRQTSPASQGYGSRCYSVGPANETRHFRGVYAPSPPQAVQARASARVEDFFAAKGRERPWQGVAAKSPHPRATDPVATRSGTARKLAISGVMPFPPQAVQARASARVEDRFAANGRERPWQGIAAKSPHPRPTDPVAARLGVANETRHFRGVYAPFPPQAVQARASARVPNARKLPFLSARFTGLLLPSGNSIYLHYRDWRREMDRTMMGTSQGAPRLDDGLSGGRAVFAPCLLFGGQSRRVILGRRWFLGNCLTVQLFREAAENFASTSGAKNFRSGWIVAN